MSAPFIQTFHAHEEGIRACRKLLNTRDVLEPPPEDIIKLVTLILKRNNFSFNNEHYIQEKGTTKGTCMTPSYANIFMDDLERRILANVDRVPIKWWRYIDDIFAIWPRGEEHLTTFLYGINNFHTSIKFIAEWSYVSMTFLDTKVTIDDEGRLVTDLYVKPTDILISISTGAGATRATANVAFLIARPSGCAESAAGQRNTASERTEGPLN